MMFPKKITALAHYLRIGRESLQFDAHRIFVPEKVRKLFAELDLLEFSLIDDRGKSIRRRASFQKAAARRYGYGLFVFKKTETWMPGNVIRRISGYKPFFAIRPRCRVRCFD